MKPYLALDFGGTRLAAAVVNLESAQVLQLLHAPTPQDAQASLSCINRMAESLVGVPGQAGLSGIGVSFGGPVEMDGRTLRTSHHVHGWEGFPLAERLESTWQLPVRVANDADAAALGEFHFGAGRGQQNLLYLTVSTGIGGGVIIQRQLYRGERGWAGEIGHMPLQPGGPLCPCGRSGCLEALASGRSIARQMRQRLAQHPNPSQDLESLSARQVAEMAAAGDPVALDVWQEAMRWLGIGIASAANLLDPGCVVVGGGLTQAGELLFNPVRAAFRQYALDEAMEVVPALLGAEANLLGAAANFSI